MERQSDDARSQSRARSLRRLGLTDQVFRQCSAACAVSVLLILGGIVIYLIVVAAPAIATYGVSFFGTPRWAESATPPVFGAIAPLYGTIVTSIVAMLIALPVGIGIAIFLTELCPERLRRPIGVAVELLAGIPSIIYGLWGYAYLGPFLTRFIEPPIIWLFTYIPGLNYLFAGPTSFQSLFLASLVLAIMILPFITAIARDVFTTVPSVLKEAAYGVGCTKWEVMTSVVIPFTRAGLVGGVMLALGRALGETMAVTFIVGSSFDIKGSIFAPGTTISATIANKFGEAQGMQQAALFYLGLILFVLTFVVLAAARLMLHRLSRKAGT